jgi:hypothetical protein
MMSTAELKINLINRITKLDDIKLVEQIQRLLDFELNEDVYKLSKAQTDRIVDAKKEYAEGKIISEKHANSEIEQWLKEK